MEEGVKGHAPSLYPRETHPMPIIQDAGWAPESIWKGAKNKPPPEFDSRIVQALVSRYTD